MAGRRKVVPHIECFLRVAYRWPQRAMIEAPCPAPRSLCRPAYSRCSADRPTGHRGRGVSRLQPAAPAVSLPGPPAWSRPLPESRAGSRAAPPSQRQVVQSECVPALIAALEAIPVGAAVEVIAPTSLRYLVEGAAFPPGSPQHDLAQLAAARRTWARDALGELEAPVATCLSRAYDSLAPLRWPGQESGLVLYTDGGCTPEVCAAAWILRCEGTTIAERAWTLDAHAAPDQVRLAEFSAAADGLMAVPIGAPVALVSDQLT